MTGIKIYVGSDGKLHFVDATGADSVLPFNSDVTHTVSFRVIADGTQYVKLYAYVDGEQVMYNNWDCKQTWDRYAYSSTI